MHALQAYAQDREVYDDDAYTFSSLYCGGILMMYSSYLAQLEGRQDRSEYYTH
jgi:hypothetical protein